MRILLPTAVAALLLASSSIATAQRVGTTAAVNPDATGQPPGGQSRLLIVGADVVFEERIVTSENGQTQLLFLDQSSLTVGPNAEVVLDRFVYDPDTSTGELALSITKGVFRFVGGKISANNGATIDTPAATLGIRGSIVYGAADEACAGGAAASAPSGGTCLDLVYVAGDQLTARNSAGTATFQRSGRKIAIASASQIARDLGRATAADIAGFTQVLEGTGGGGAPETPTEVVVQQQLGPAPSDGTALPDPGQNLAAAAAASSAAAVATVTESNDVSDVLNEAATEDTAKNQPDPQGTLTGRLLATPDAPFTSDDGTFYGEPLTQNVLGGPDLDFSPAVSHGVITSSGRFRASTDAGPVDLPFQLGAFTFGPAGTQTPFGPIAGIGAGASDFVAYAGTQANSSAGDRVFIIAGQPTPDAGNLPSPNLQLSTYEVLQDPVYQAEVPFVPGDVANAFANPTVSDIHFLRRDGDRPGENGRIADNSSPNRSRFVIVAGAIEGEGASQKSFLFGSEGRLITSTEGELSISLGTRGSFRLGAGEKPARLGGSIAPVSDANANQFFGPDLDFFALTTSGPALIGFTPEVDVGSAYYDPYAFNAGRPYSYTHLVRKTAADRTLNTRTSRSLSGYAAVIGESRLVENVVFPAPYLLTAREPTVDVLTDASTNSIAATFDMTEIGLTGGIPDYRSDVDRVRIGFGGIGLHVGSYIDDDRYAARDTRDPNRASRVNGDAGLSTSTSNPDGARSILVAHELLSLNGFPANGVTLADCACFEWGWWASDFRWADTSGENRFRRERFHMGTFVVGEISDPSDVQDIISMGHEATYGGHIIGNVYNEGAQYIAAGNFSHTVDFGTRSGNVTATFDNRSYTGASNFKANISGFEGHLASTDETREAFMDGSFIRDGADPVGGMIGTKRFYDTETHGNTYRASTTFAGVKQAGSLPQN